MADTPDAPNWLFSPVVWAAGLAGAIVSQAHAVGLTLRGRLVAIFVGLLTAGFLTPAVADWMTFSQSLTAAAAFLIGMCGMLLTGIILQAALYAKQHPGTFWDWIKAALVRSLGLKEPPDRIEPPAGGKP